MPNHFYDELFADKLFDPEFYQEKKDSAASDSERDIKEKLYPEIEAAPIYYQGPRSFRDIVGFIFSSNHGQFLQEMKQVVEKLINFSQKNSIDIANRHPETGCIALPTNYKSKILLNLNNFNKKKKDAL